MHARGTRAADGSLRLQIGEHRVAATVVANGDRRVVFLGGHAYSLTHVDRLALAGADDEETGNGLVAPMPGKVIALVAALGTRVDKGAPLLVLEAIEDGAHPSAHRAPAP